ncbi:MAG: hypothetical protein ISR58_07550 [Anaerolineales bacterium]|nr:hypothetical protein [Chloroflexota bacterium]MBL6981031.1 hypothetical protein [Anaerolineales bacterium]
MILRDFSPIPYQGGKLPITDLLRAILQHGFSWPAEMKSQDTVVRYLNRTLDNSYTLLRNVSLPDVDVNIPFILAGPSGVTVISDSAAEGVFRARENVWAMMDKRSGAFRSSKPNLLMRTMLLSRAVDTYLNEKGFTEISSEGVLVLTNPGTHVDTDRPSARVILVDGLKRFGSQISNAPPIMDRERRYKLIKSIEIGREAAEEDAIPEATPGSALPQSIDSGFDQAVSPLRKKANFSRRQWIILGAFVIVEVIILLIFMFLILSTA